MVECGDAETVQPGRVAGGMGRLVECGRVIVIRGAELGS
jgi:hypothetical protein